MSFADHFVRIALILALGLAGASCSPASRLPSDARQALEATWSELDPAYAAGLRISRAWRSQVSAEELTPWAPDMETWCVEVEGATSQPDGGQNEAVIWIVTRPDADSPWSAAMLMTMSATWPYQACERAP